MLAIKGRDGTLKSTLAWKTLEESSANGKSRICGVAPFVLVARDSVLAVTLPNSRSRANDSRTGDRLGLLDVLNPLRWRLDLIVE